jgi:formamidopyrimidine-DNA glycosylase
MPELPEVTLSGQYLISNLKNRYITGIHVIAGKYTHQTLPGKDLIAKHQPLKIINVDSKGKFMWFELKDPNNQDIYIMNNFGLTGEWSFHDDKSDRVIFDIETHPGNPETNQKYKLHFSDARNFGLLQITDSRKVLNSKIDKLAPDLLKSNFTADDFVQWVHDYLRKSPKRKDVPIVAALLKQDKKDGIASGIGNYLSSEILYRAKISPYTPVGQLSDADLRNLANVIKRVVKLCYMSNTTGYMKKMADFVEKHKEKVEKGIFPDYHPDVHLQPSDTFEFLSYGRKQDNLGNKVERDVIAGTRTTYWVPAIQK